MGITKETASELLLAARKAAGRAYAPYSGFCVGAALLTADGKVFLGANVENSAYGESICAERAAVVSAVSAGERDFVALAVAAPKGEDTTPCGSCRQVLNEFSPEALVVTQGGSNGPRLEPLSALLPRPFKL